MNVRKFIAANAREALRKVKETLGPDAIILSNRGVPGGVEIMAVAAKDMAMIVPPAEERPFAAPPSSLAHSLDDMPDEDDYRVNLSRQVSAFQGKGSNAPQSNPLFNMPLRQPGIRVNAEKPAAQKTPVPLNVNASIPKTAALRQAMEAAARPANGNAPGAEKNAASARTFSKGAAENAIATTAMMEEIRSLRKIVEQHLAGFAWGEIARSDPVKTEVLRQMLEVGFSPQFTRELLLDLPSDMDALRALAWMRGAADQNLITAPASRDIIDTGGVYALVGPTGVGKTTTAAKLAARCVLRHGASKVALVTTDSYRIGAHEQLRIYGRILGITVYAAKDAEELKQVLDELKSKHMVLIDTMGMSQKDRLVVELNAMLSQCSVQRLLLLSAVARGDTLDDVIRAYRGNDLAGCVLTKIDEAVSLAPPLDAVMRHGLMLHYVTNGQRVPEDLHLPNRAYLLHRAFKETSDEAHRYDEIAPGLMMASAGLMPVPAAGGKRG